MNNKEPLDNVKAEYPVTIRFTELQIKYLEYLAKEEDRSINYVVRQLVSKAIDEAESP